MLISTMNDLPGYAIEEVFGEVFGLTVRARNIGSQIGAGLKSLIGGELGGMTKMLAQGREEAIQRLVAEAERIFGDAEVRAWPKSRGGLNGPQSAQLSAEY